VNLLYTTYDKSGEGKMSFDLFVVKRMTDVFKRYDDDRDGYITLSFEEFLTGKWHFGLLTVCAYSHLQKYYVNDEAIMSR